MRKVERETNRTVKEFGARKAVISKPLVYKPEPINKLRNQDPGAVEQWISRLYVIFIAFFIVGMFAAAYYGYDYIRSYVFAKSFEPVITLLCSEPPTVGRTITLRIRFRRKATQEGGRGKLIPFNSKDFQTLQHNISLVFTNNGVTRNVAILTEANSANNSLIVKFSLRKAGRYQVDLHYKRRFILAPESEHFVPFSFDVASAMPTPKYIDFGTHNPQYLYVIMGMRHYFRIRAKDEYGNICQAKDVELEKLDFQIQNSVVGEKEFCLHHPTHDFAHQRSCPCLEEDERHHGEGESVCLKLKLNDPGIYVCNLTYQNLPIRGNGVPRQKLIACLSPEEDDELRCLYEQRLARGAVIYSCKCKTHVSGDESGPFDGFVGISAGWLTIAKIEWALHMYPMISFPINGKTNIHHLGNSYEESEHEVVLLIKDGFRKSLHLYLEPASARKLLVSFGHNQGFKLPRMGTTFLQKKEHLQGSLQMNFLSQLFISPIILHVQHGNVIRSTLKSVPKLEDDWHLPFSIIYEGAPAQKSTVSAWLNKLCDEFFSPNEDTGMFHYLEGSKLLHPRSSGFSRQPLEFYHLAGNILAKAILESLLRNACTILSTVRFSRSMLGYLLGFSVSYKYLETDEPKFFRQIKSILESDVTGKNIFFTAPPETQSSTNIINLVQDGSTLEVTNENKEHYLNLLTKHRLIRPVELELKELRNGFNEVLSIDKLCDFNEFDLELLISGGRPIIIDELMERGNHRIVKELDTISSMTRLDYRLPPVNHQKILSWFRVAASNMSDKEKSNLLFFATGSFSLPSCGWGALNPKLTISLTGTFNQLPQGNPIIHEIILGDHVYFDNFEKSLIEAITPASERIILPTTLDQSFVNNYLMLTIGAADNEDIEMEEDEANRPPPPQALDEDESSTAMGSGTVMDPFVRWLRGFVNL